MGHTCPTNGTRGKRYSINKIAVFDQQEENNRFSRSDLMTSKPNETELAKVELAISVNRVAESFSLARVRVYFLRHESMIIILFN